MYKLFTDIMVKIITMKDARLDGQLALEDVLDNPEISLFDKWNFYLAFADDLYSLGGSPDGELGDVLVGMYDLNRYQAYKYSSMFGDSFMSPMEEGYGTSDWYRAAFEEFEKIPTEAVRQVLESGDSGFVFDW